jgi:DNA polymerase III alpha subunit (gram-positive type)
MIRDGVQMRAFEPALDTPLSCITYAVLDTETTGVTNRDRVVEIAVQRVTMDARPLAPIFSSLVNPGPAVTMSPIATEVTGITNAMIHAAGVPSFSSIYPELMQQLQGCVIVAHNAAFDRRLVMQSCEGQLLPPMQPWLCTWRDLSKRLLPSLASHKLIDVCGHYGISMNSAHRASGDVEALAKVLPRLFKDAELRGIRTWGELQQFIGQKPSKSLAPSSVIVAGAASGASSSSSSSSYNKNPQLNGNVGSSDTSRNPPAPYDARAPCGAHEWDSATRKWNGNMHGPKKSDGRPDMRRKENFE